MVSSTNSAMEKKMESTMEWSYGEVMRAIIFVVSSNGGEASFEKVAAEFSSSAEYPEGTRYDPVIFLDYIINEWYSVFDKYSILYDNGVFRVF